MDYRYCFGALCLVGLFGVFFIYAVILEAGGRCENMVNAMKAFGWEDKNKDDEGLHEEES